VWCEAIVWRQISIEPGVENFPFNSKISGWQLAQNIYEQALSQGADIRFEQVYEVIFLTALKGCNRKQDLRGKDSYQANGAKTKEDECR
jgi:hypothetical protein